MIGRITKLWREPAGPKEIVGLQYLRGLAAIGVVMYHAAEMGKFDKYFGQEAFHGFFRWSIRVELLFAVSGFIIAAVSLRASSLEPRLGRAEFFWKRAIRILPMMWLAISSYALLRYLGRGDLRIMPYVNAMFALPLGKVEPNHLWTLRQEWLFYILFAFTALTSKNRIWLLAIWFLSPLMIGATGRNVDEGTASYWLRWVSFNPSNLMFGVGFAAGWLYLKYPKPFSVKRISKGYPVLIAVFILAQIAALTFKPLMTGNSRTILTAFICLAIVLIALWTATETDAFSRVGRMFGDASYSIYLFHPHIVSAMLGIWSSRFPDTPVSLAVGAISGAAVATGVFIHYSIERPLTKRLQASLTKRRHAVPAERTTKQAVEEVG
jgi:peptidoglycan/LPS O-acetylase OafA/YrhL